MSAIQQTLGLATFELRGAARSRWVMIGAGIFAAAALGATISGLRSFASLGLAGAAAATDGLMQVTLLLPPLIGMLLGAGSLARDREGGLLAMFASQPVGRTVLPLATFLGGLLAVWAVVAFGLGVGGVLISTVATVADVLTLATVVAVALATAATSVAIGVAIAALASTHQQATTAAAAMWLLLALGLDLLLVGVAPGLRLAPSGLLASVLLNPIEAARVLVLLLVDGPGALGPFGGYLLDRVGRTGAVGVLVGSLVAWTLGPLAVATLAIHRRDI
ncbi:MAG: ABC transporter permease subunit [Nitriliruptoraceae bacterium]